MTTKIQTREEAEKVCVYWACDNPEELTHETPGEAIADYLENHVDDLPETISLTGYVRMKVECEAYFPLGDLLERLDEEHGDSDGDPYEPTEAMKAAEKVFVEAVLAEYKNHWCEDVYHETIVVSQWCEKHAPELLEGLETRGEDRS